MVPSPADEPISFATVLAERLSRRGLLALGGAVAVAALAPGATRAGTMPRTSLDFPELPHGLDADAHVPDSHRLQVLIRWGDPVLPGAPAFDPARQSAAAQSLQFGYNNDMIAWFPLPYGSGASDHGLLAVNHEYTDTHLMFAGFADGKAARQNASREQVEIELAAHGISVIEIRREGADWRVVPGPFSRRVDGFATACRLSGPVAGDPRVRTSADPEGRTVIGTLGNCAGGWTPWGTYLSGEENFNSYFSGKTEAPSLTRYGIAGKPAYPAWGRHLARFDVEREPNEAHRFGWVVEVDPYEPTRPPRKRTALGRFKHEGATTALTADGRLVVYSGDDEALQYVYRFVSRDRVDLADRKANEDLLDHGTLSVARFDADGGLRWLPLVQGRGTLTAENGFSSQADVLIETRRAADLLRPTPMDRPEDVETNPVTGKVYVVLTKNDRRAPEQTDAANPRAANRYGHIIEMSPPMVDGRPDHGADVFAWDLFLKAGNPARAEDGALLGAGTSEAGWFSNPDNIAFDRRGRLWILTDGFPDFGVADGVWACDTEGEARAQTRHFLAVPQGAEMCGGAFTGDDGALFLSVQHPGEDSLYDAPSTRWPDFRDDLPPRPAVIVVTRKGGGPIGG